MEATEVFVSRNPIVNACVDLYMRLNVLSTCSVVFLVVKVIRYILPTLNDFK